MSKNTYKQDESLETPFSFGQYRRALGYVSKYSQQMILAITLSVLSAVLTLSAPMITGKVVDEIIPSKDVKLLFIWVGLLLVFIAIAMVFVSIRAKIMARVGQAIVYDIRSDLFTHLQYLSFDYYDKRPDGKILIRLVNYVNSVSDMLSNGLVNLILEFINVFIILAFMFYVNTTLSWIILSGVPIGLLAILIVRRHQRKAWQELSNKASNTNAYLQESINGMQVTQIYNRERENLDIFANLSQEYKESWISAVRLNALFPFVVDNIMNIITMVIYA
ncbi:MAG TPA: ABC transporter ATP-binding protein, partial [Erysipelothrix sp.]|nr:ABC transporter ATP-binding protein [Erysipelothrix sp.]